MKSLPIPGLFRTAVLATVVLVLGTLGVRAQGENVGIGTATPNPSALLDLTSTTKGLLTPRMTQAQRDAIVRPATGLIIYNTTANVYEFNSGTEFQPIWSRMISVSGGNSGNDFWSTTGNAGIDPAQHFLGTTDNRALVLRTNDQVRLTITESGTIVAEEQVRINGGGLFLAGTASPIIVDGSAGARGSVLVSNGAGQTPEYTDSLTLRGLAAGTATITNATIGTASVATAQLGTATVSGALTVSGPTVLTGPVGVQGQATFTTLPVVPLQRSYMLVGDANNVAQPMAPGANGEVLGMANGQPSWVDLNAVIASRAWTVGGNANPSSSILGNTNTTGIVDLDLRAGNVTLLHLDGTSASLDVYGPLNLSGTTTPLLLNGNPGQAGNVLVSAGPGNTPQWSPLAALPVWTRGGNAGIQPTDYLGTTDANDLRLATNGTPRVTIAQGSGDVSMTSLAGPVVPVQSGPNEGVVVADASGTLHKRGKEALFALFGVAAGRYVNTTAGPLFTVVITMPAGTTVDTQASITLTPEASSSVGITPFVVNGSRTASTFTIAFPGGLNPGEAINWMMINP